MDIGKVGSHVDRYDDKRKKIGPLNAKIPGPRRHNLVGRAAPRAEKHEKGEG